MVKHNAEAPRPGRQLSMPSISLIRKKSLSVLRYRRKATKYPKEDANVVTGKQPLQQRNREKLQRLHSNTNICEKEPHRSINEVTLAPSANNNFDKSKQIIDYEMRLGNLLQSKLAQIPAMSSHSERSLQLAKEFLASRKKLDTFRQLEQCVATTTGHSSAASASVLKACRPSQGTLLLSDVRIPLAWKGRDHFRNRGDSRRFAAFLLVRCGEQIRDTHLIYDFGRETTDVYFSDLLKFNDVNPEFSLTLDLYCCNLDHDAIIPFDLNLSGSGSLKAHTPKLKKSLRRSLGQKLGSLVRRNLDDFVGEPAAENVHFLKVASATLRLIDVVNDGFIHSYDFDAKSIDSDTEICPPLYGCFCCKLVLQVPSAMSPIFQGHLTISAPGTSETPYYVELKRLKLFLWRSVASCSDETNAALSINIDRDTIIQQSRRHRGIIVTLPVSSNYEQFLILAANDKEAAALKHAIEQMITDHCTWGDLIRRNVAVDSIVSEKTRPYYLRSTGCRLYDEISIHPQTSPQNKQQWPHYNLDRANEFANSSYSVAIGDQTNIASTPNNNSLDFEKEEKRSINRDLDRNSLSRTAVHKRKCRPSILNLSDSLNNLKPSQLETHL